MNRASSRSRQPFLLLLLTGLCAGCYIRDPAHVDPRRQPDVWVAARLQDGAQRVERSVETAPGGTSSTPASEAARVPEDSYRPTGHGPVPFETRGGWKVVEAGQRWRVTREEGTAVEGIVVGVSQRAIAIDPGNGVVVVVLSQSLDDLARR